MVQQVRTFKKARIVWDLLQIATSDSPIDFYKLKLSESSINFGWVRSV